MMKEFVVADSERDRRWGPGRDAGSNETTLRASRGP